MALVDMARSEEEMRERNGDCAPCAIDESKYPYGLTINLEDGSLQKLGLTQLPDVGATMTITARVEVCSTSQYSGKRGETDRSLTLQITAMEIGDAQESMPEGDDFASVLYGGMAPSGVA